MKLFASLILCILPIFDYINATPTSSQNWELQISPDGVKFSARNAHASCVFKGRVWVTGGRTNEYTMYNLLPSYKVGDVWYTDDGQQWAQESELTGDFFAQNIDVVQPGSISPWYQRYGHSLNAIDINDDGEQDLMVLAGGYASSPSNDVWVTEDGKQWIYTGLAPWSPRAWHMANVFKGKLFIMGGTPLNNEVWRLDRAVKVSPIPKDMERLTRAMYANFTYKLSWTQITEKAPWSPRVGGGLISQFFFNISKSEDASSSKERMILIGGYGGYVDKPHSVEAEMFDGYFCRPDIWETYNGYNWSLLTSQAPFGGRAWFGLVNQHAKDPRVDLRLELPPHAVQPPKIYLFGGGYIGYQKNSNKKVTSMIGRADAYWTRDGVNWTQINYQEGGANGGSNGFPFYSSQEWSKTIVDTNTYYIGMWGMTVHSFNVSTKEEFPGDLMFIAGDYTGRGDFSNNVFRSKSGIYCDVGGTACNGQGSCGSDGCICKTGWEGLFCEHQISVVVSGASRHISLLLSGTMMIFVTAIVSIY